MSLSNNIVFHPKNARQKCVRKLESTSLLQHRYAWYFYENKSFLYKYSYLSSTELFLSQRFCFRLHLRACCFSFSHLSNIIGPYSDVSTITPTSHSRSPVSLTFTPIWCHGPHDKHYVCLSWSRDKRLAQNTAHIVAGVAADCSYLLTVNLVQPQYLFCTMNHTPILCVYSPLPGLILLSQSDRPQ